LTRQTTNPLVDRTVVQPDMTMDETKISELVERVARIEAELPHIYQELQGIRHKLDNDLPHQIAALQRSVEAVSRRYSDLDAISRFLSVCLKGLALLLGTLWTARQLFGKFGGQ